MAFVTEEYHLQEGVENGEDPVLVANNAVALILNEPNMLFRREMITSFVARCRSTER